MTPPDATIDPTAPLAVRLGQRIKQLRLAQGLTQTELSRRCAITRENIARLEAGRSGAKQGPCVATLFEVADGLGVELTDVVVVLDRRWVLEETRRRERASRGVA
jgi:transcriptional regulator with XRE-family HTH domain